MSLRPTLAHAREVAETARAFLLQLDPSAADDESIYDSILTTRTHSPGDDVAIISIDDASLSEIGRWPWSRRTHAALIDNARDAGASAVVLDVLLDTPSHDDAEADRALARSMQAYGRVILPLTQATTGNQLTGEVLPLPLFAESAAAIGHSQVEFDTDGIARSVYLWEGRGRPDRSQFVLAMLERLAPAELAPLRGERPWRRNP